jgi:hypothetical protein
MPTHEIKYTENGGDVPVHYADTIIIDNGTVYTVVYHAQLNEYNTYDDVAILMIDSFQPAPGSQITARALRYYSPNHSWARVRPLLGS